MPLDKSIKKVLVVGSGPIIIGQAAEFDYAGTQACRALREEGIEVVLVNSNPATIMTDTSMADRLYMEPLTSNVLKNIIRKEKPDSMLATLGGQTGLNLAMELYESGFLEEEHVRLLGTDFNSIKTAEDRESFKETMISIGEPVIESVIVTDVDGALNFAETIGYPVIVRPAYTLGGTGGGIAKDEAELREICHAGLQASRVGQCLIERSVAGYKEIEFEVLRDGKGNCITVCSMENIDPVGIHTGDSIVTAPAQTLSDKEFQMLRSSAIRIIDSLGIEGGCNVQYALDTRSMNYYLIEVNPRVSRSSALASKATGFPIAKTAAKIAIGYGLDEIKNGVTGKTYACAEPTIDYVVMKFPRWPFDKFTAADKQLGTRMKATGEVMAIGWNFEAALLKAVRSLELGFDSLESKFTEGFDREALIQNIKEKDDERLFYIAQAMRIGVTDREINEITEIDYFFLRKIRNIVDMEEKLKQCGTPDRAILLKAKHMGIGDSAIARYIGKTENEVRALRKGLNVMPSYKTVDTCSAEFEAVSPYYYSTYGEENEATTPKNKTVVVLGSGPIRIGQGVEFDYCSVHSVWALKKAGYDTVIVNNNPETVSTDFDTSDRLYFEPLTPEDVLNVLEQEKPVGVVVQFGGQTAIKLAKYVDAAGYKILGTDLEHIDAAEDREVFDEVLESIGVSRPQGLTVFTEDEAVAAAEKLGYPVLVRPSYVLGGQGMEIAYEEKNVREYMRIIGRAKQEHPILIDKYMVGKELEVDAVCDGEDILIPGIMEHIERAGVHSGDSISVYPPVSIPESRIREITDVTHKLAKALKVVGLMNVQYVISKDKLYVIEVNPRASRTVPYISKVTGVPFIDVAIETILGKKLKSIGCGTGLHPSGKVFAIKVPVFSFEKLPQVEVSLGPEMKSTGEVLGLSRDYNEAVFKGLIAAGVNVPYDGGKVIMTIADQSKQESIPIGAVLDYLGFDIYATEGTANLLNFNFVAANKIGKFDGASPNVKELIESDTVKLIINTPTKGRLKSTDGFRIRRMAVERSIPCLTSLDTAKALAHCLKLRKSDADLEPLALQELSE